MKPEWLSDARLILDEEMNYLPKITVHAVEEKLFQTGGGHQDLRAES